MPTVDPSYYLPVEAWAPPEIEIIRIKMLVLNLRQEFRGKRLKGTAIELSNESNTGATQIAAAQFLEITYPTHDLLKGIEAVGPNQGRPVVVIGERGLGKSHLMAALYAPSAT